MSGRGEHLLDAVVDVIAEHGLSAISMRTVATRAGVSLAQVQYYFRTKDDLLAAAYAHVNDTFLARVANVDRTGDAADVLRAVVREWLPLDAERVRDARVWAAFTAAAATAPALREQCRQIDEQIRGGLARLVEAAQHAGFIDLHREPSTEAAVLLAVIDGLVLQSCVLDDSTARELVLTGIEAHFTSLFSSPRVTAPPTKARRP